VTVAVETLWGPIYTDDAGIHSRSSTGVEKMVSIIVRVAGSFGVMASEPNTEPKRGWRNFSLRSTPNLKQQDERGRSLDA